MTTPAPEHWGVCPTLHLGGVAIPAYGAFMLLALIAGITVYVLLARKHPVQGQQGLLLLLAAVIGGVLGAKIPVWVMNWRQILDALPDIGPILSGRTVVGGLIGGVLSVILMRRWLGIAMPSGNLFTPAIALAIAVGRVGCFCAGCCYGTPVSWGVNFGDGVPRHPTQLYESAFALALFVFLLAARRRFSEPGRLFGIFMIAYFAFRFGVEFLRAGDATSIGLTMAQIVSLGVVAYYLRNELGRIRIPQKETAS